MELFFTPAGEEQFDRLTIFHQQRIATKMRYFASQPDPLKFAEPLTGSDKYRFRIGDHRVMFEVLHNSIWITAVKRRDEAYR